MFCSLYKWRISSSLDSDEPMSARLRRHLDRCPQCERFYRRCLEIGPRLTAEADSALAESDVSPALHAQILRHCREGRGQSAARPGGAQRRRRRPTLVAAAALLLLGILAALFLAAPGEPQPERKLADETHPVVWLADAPALAATSAAVIEGALEEALEVELASLGAEARAMADVLLDALPMDTSADNGPETP